jgi:alanine dehydrogenase
MLFLDNSDVARVLEMRDCIDAQREAFDALGRGEAVYRPRIDMYVPCDEPDGYYRWGSCEGASHGVLAVRLKSDVITWPRSANGGWSERKYCVEPGTYSGMIFLYSTRNGEPLAMMKDGYLQHMRVGGAAGIGCKLLARPESCEVGMIGSGAMARTFLEAIVAELPIKRVRVFSPNSSNCRRYAQEMSAELSIEAVPVASPREAVAGADIVATCTDSMTPVLDPNWLEPGMHVVSLQPRELTRETYARFDVTVAQGSEQLRMENTRYFRKDVTGTPGAFICGTEKERERIPKSTRSGELESWPNYVDISRGYAAGRTDPGQITFYNTVGNWGVQFSSVGALVHRKAREQGHRQGDPDGMVPAGRPQLGRGPTKGWGDRAPSAPRKGESTDRLAPRRWAGPDGILGVYANGIPVE